MFNKMVLLPERDYNNFLNPSNSVTTNLTDQLLNIQRKALPLDVKNLYESDILSKLRNFRTEAPSNVLSREQIIDNIPEKQKRKAAMVLDSIGPNAWVENGNLVKDGRQIPNSNIVDLLHRATVGGNIKHAFGWKDFEDLLIRSNVPKTALSSNTQKEIINSLENSISNEEPSPVKEEKKKVKERKKETPISARTRAGQRGIPARTKSQQKGRGFVRIPVGLKLLKF